MTTSIQNASADITDFETEFDDLLALSRDGQELLFRGARTANTFTDEPVTDEQVKAIYDLAKWAPTSMNNQPLRIVLVRSSQARERLAQPMADGNKQNPPPAPRGPTLPAAHPFHENSPKTFPHSPGPRDMFA